MSTAEHPEPTHSRYDSCDPKYLRDLRLAAGIEVDELARTACLSVAQIRALESDAGGDFFYSHTIRRQAYKRVLMILGAEPPTVEVPAALRDAQLVAQAHRQTLDQIVSMSHLPPMNYTFGDRLRETGTALFENRQAVGAMLMLVAAVGVFVLYGPLNLVPDSPPVVATTAKVEVAVAATIAPEPVAVASVPAVVVASAPPVMASTPFVAAAAPASAPSASKVEVPLSCAYSADAIPQASPFVARKEGTYVYLVSSGNVEVCVVDGNKKATLLQMKAGENRNVPGVSPWQISGSNLQQVQIYFQGGRVMLPDDTSRRLKLVETPVER